jgi:hypothetical protein
MKLSKIGVATTIAYAFAFASGVSAATIGATLDLKAKPVVQAGATTSVSGSTFNTTNGASAGASADDSVGAAADVSAAASSSAAEGLVVTRADVAGEAPAPVEPASVVTSSDLDAYARAVIRSDDNISKVGASADEVSVWYKEHGKFLGLIPVAVTTRATIHADGTVSIDRPWYDFLTVSQNDDKIKADIEATAGTIARAEGQAEFSTNTQARLVNALRSVMKAHYMAGMSATSTEDVDVDY